MVGRWVASYDVAWEFQPGYKVRDSPSNPTSSTHHSDSNRITTASMASTITTISPVSGSPIITRQSVTESHFPAILATAQKAFSTFRHTHPLAARQEIVKKALQVLGSRADELGKEITEQMGRPIAYTPKEVATAVKRGEYLLKVSDEALKDTPGEAEEGFRRWIRKEPLGVVLVIFAWNVSLLWGLVGLTG